MSESPVAVVGPRDPCPCGSGRRYKACHGKAQARSEHTRVLRPFEGLASEAEWVAMREIVSAGTARVTMSGDHAGRTVTLASVLPMAWPALVRTSGEVMVAAQTQTTSADVSRDLADALLQALDAEPGTPVPPRPLPPDAPRLQDLVDPAAPLSVTLHSSFDFWVDEADVDERTRASLDSAGAAVVPTARLATVEAGYWVRLGERTQLRWVLPEDENALLDAFARLHAAGQLELDARSRYLGSFRALGLTAPVWDLAPGMEVDDVEEPAAALRERLTQALADSTPLTGQQRRVRQGLAGRQLTLS